MLADLTILALIGGAFGLGLAKYQGPLRNATMLDKAFFDSLFYYDPEDGELYRRRDGALAGSRSDGRYVRVSIGQSQRRYAHHVIWCMLRGVWVENGIDHWDGDGFNNREYNLRDANQSQNIANAAWGESRGIEKHGAKWRARIVVNNRRLELGSFASREEAIAAYRAGAEKHFGEFAEHNRPN